MTTQRVYLSLGSNLGDREANLRAAVDALERELDGITVSEMFETDPVGVTTQPAFVNVALVGDTRRGPRDLLTALKAIETEVGRTPTYRWGPRVVDIDILFYADLVLTDHDLIIPHKELPNRAFVLVPLAEIAPDLKHPVSGSTIRELRDRVSGLHSVRRVRAW